MTRAKHRRTNRALKMPPEEYFNEMYAADGSVRKHYAALSQWLTSTSNDRIAQMREAAQVLFHRVGITFAVNGDTTGGERLIPFDILPHVIPAAEWHMLQSGLRQRVHALNMFLHDVYHNAEIVQAGKVPRHKVFQNQQYRAQMRGIDLPNQVYAHIAGIDLVRAGHGEYYVLEDNLRTPSGVSYMLENRKMTMRLMPELFAQQPILPVEHYPDLLLDMLRSVAPQEIG